VPLTVEEARALMTEALTDVDRSALLAERAEAEAQLRAAEATLGAPPPVATNGRAGSEQDSTHDGEEAAATDGSLDAEALRQAATAARVADDALARAASEAAERPLPSEAQLGTAESSFAEALEAREDLPAAWRRLVGALISSTGMAIVIGALGWNVYWLLAPIALIAIMTVDLRVAGRAAREASVQAARELASVGVAGAEGLDRIRAERTKIEAAEARLADARADRDAAYDRFQELAPGRLPSEVEAVIAEYEAQRSAPPDVAPEAPEPAPAPAPAPTPARPLPPPPPAPVRALAERLSAEGREALARVEAQLAALDRVELAKKSLQWHETQSAPPEAKP
jgi:hypothetical protein